MKNECFCGNIYIRNCFKVDYCMDVTDFSYDKLILYAILMFGVGVLIRIINQVYSIKTFSKVHFLWPKIW